MKGSKLKHLPFLSHFFKRTLSFKLRTNLQVTWMKINNQHQACDHRGSIEEEYCLEHSMKKVKGKGVVEDEAYSYKEKLHGSHKEGGLA